MALQRILSLSDLPFTQSAQEGNPSGIVPSLKATGSIGNMQYEAATAGAAGNSISITHQLAEFAIPAKPSAPSFSGTLRTIGSGGSFDNLGQAFASTTTSGIQTLPPPGGTLNVTSTAGFKSSGTLLVTSNLGTQTITYTGVTGVSFTGCSGGSGSVSMGATVSTVVASGDRLQLIGASITETGLVSVNKQVEIFSAVNTVVQRTSTAAVLQVAVGGVYIHDFTITNNQLASADAGGQSCCINADTMNRNAYNGVSNIYIKNMTFNHPKVGVFMSGTGWVVTDCTFNVNAASQTAATTIRHVFMYGTTSNCFIENNTINTTADASRSIGIYFDTRNDGQVPAYASGYKGALIVKNNTIVKNGSVGAPRAYIDATGFYRQSGLASTNGNLNEFSLYIVNNNFGTDYASSPCVFFGRTGVLPFAFFNTLLVQNNSFGKRTSGSEKGALFFTSASGLASRSMGSFGGTFYASNNTITAATLPATSFSIMAVSPDLLMVRDNTYYDAPSPLLTPAEPVGSFSVQVVGDAVTVNVPPNNPATTLASSLNANGSFAALVAATAANGSNASTTGTTTLSGGVG